MKNLKIFSLMLATAAMALIGVTSLQAVDLEGNPPPNLSTRGGGMDSGGYIIQGKYPKSHGGLGVPCVSSSVSITARQLVALTATGGTLAVTLTTTVGDTKAYGVAVTSALAGQPLQVVTMPGCAVLVDSAINVVAGSIYISSGTAGKITASSAVTEASYTALSKTAFIIRALETKTISAGDYRILGEILK